MNQARALRGPAARGDTEHGKKRVPYALRACDACRKRKGKCCGRNPCEYCVARNQPCKFSSHAGDGQLNVGNQAAGMTLESRQPQMPVSWAPEYASHGPGTDFLYANRKIISSVLGSLGELVANLQGQIDTLAAQMRQNGDRNGSVDAPSLASSETLVRPATSSQPIDINPSPGTGYAKQGQLSSTKTDANKESGLPRGEFYGPTSPDYSLNVAQIKLRQGSFLTTAPDQANLASIDENQTDDEDVENNSRQETASPPEQQLLDQMMCKRLLHFRGFFNVREAVRLLLVYQEVVGEYHPILDINLLIKQVEWWYSWPSRQPPSGLSSADEYNLLATNLAIMISLYAESNSSGSGTTEVADAIYESSRELINAKLVALVPNLNHVMIILLVGIFHFYKDMKRFAWRMCGIAGRTLMELGLHNADVSRHVLGSEKQWAVYAVITGSIVVLDRQWSACTGLPTHFTNSDFDQELTSSVKNPYLKAMTSFILMSDRFSEPSSRVASGGAYEDDDDFDIMNFQIEHWRKKTVGSFGIPQMRADQPPSSLPPAWAMLIYLRANAVQGMLLRPFFFSNTATAASRRNIQPGLDLITDSLEVLSILDGTTNIYRRQHPYFQHFLATSCALLFLIIAHVEQNRASFSDDLPDSFFLAVGRNFKNAFALANGSKQPCRSSRRLSKRLLLMEKLLIDIGILRNEKLAENDSSQGSTKTAQQPTQTKGAHFVTRGPTAAPNLGDMRSHQHPQGALLGELEHEHAFLTVSSSPSDSAFGVGAQELNLDWAASLSQDWPLNNSNGLFWGI